MPWILAAVSVAGAVLNVMGLRAGFALWIASNSCWVCHNITIGEYAQAVLYGVFLILSAWGWFAWGKG